MVLKKYKTLYGDRVLVKRLKNYQKTNTGILVRPAEGNDNFVTGVLLKAGIGVDTPLPDVGSVVRYSKVAAIEIEVDDLDMVSGKTIVTELHPDTLSDDVKSEVQEILTKYLSE